MTYEQLIRLNWHSLKLPNWRGLLVEAEPSGDSIVLTLPLSTQHLAQWTHQCGWLLRRGAIDSTFAEITELAAICNLVDAFVAAGTAQ